MFAEHHDRSVVMCPARVGGAQTGTGIVRVAITGPLIGFLLVVRAPLILPSVSLVALAAAAVIALAAWSTSTDQDESSNSLWNISGIYAFIGFAAGIVSDPQELVEFFSLRAEMPAHR